MPTSTNITNLKINELTEAQYDTAVQGGVIGVNELSIITDLDEAIQVDAMPTASANELGKVYQFIGTTDANYTHGYFYECVSDGAVTPTYSWSQLNVQPAGGGSSLPSQTGNAGKFLTTNGTIASWAGAVPQYSTMPTPTSSDNGKIVQYVGATDVNYTNGYFYKGAVAQSPAQYTVTSIDVSGSTIQEEDITDYYPNGVTVSFNEAGLSSFLQSYGYTLEDLGNTFHITIVDYQVEYENDDPENPETIVETYEYVSIAGGTVAITAMDNNDAILSQIGYTCSESFDDSAFSPMGTATGVDYGLGINYVPSSNVSEWANIDVQNTPDPLPSQTGNNGKFLTTNGTVASWGTVESLPSQTGNAGKFLKTDGTDASWAEATTTTVPTTMPTLAVNDWSSNTQTVNVTGVTANNIVFVSPAPASASDYASAGIVCTAQGSGTLTFTCTTVPSNAITVNVVILG